MEARSRASLSPELENFLRRFDDCFVRAEQRTSLRAYVRVRQSAPGSTPSIRFGRGTGGGLTIVHDTAGRRAA